MDFMVFHRIEAITFITGQIFKQFQIIMGKGFDGLCIQFLFAFQYGLRIGIEKEVEVGLHQKTETKTQQGFGQTDVAAKAVVDKIKIVPVVQNDFATANMLDIHHKLPKQKIGVIPGKPQ